MCTNSGILVLFENMFFPSWKMCARKHWIILNQNTIFMFIYVSIYLKCVSVGYSDVPQPAELHETVQIITPENRSQTAKKDGCLLMLTKMSKRGSAFWKSKATLQALFRRFRENSEVSPYAVLPENSTSIVCVPCRHVGGWRVTNIETILQ